AGREGGGGLEGQEVRRAEPGRGADGGGGRGTAAGGDRRRHLAGAARDPRGSGRPRRRRREASESRGPDAGSGDRQGTVVHGQPDFRRRAAGGAGGGPGPEGHAPPSPPSRPARCREEAPEKT